MQHALSSDLRSHELGFLYRAGCLVIACVWVGILSFTGAFAWVSASVVSAWKVIFPLLLYETIFLFDTLHRR